MSQLFAAKLDEAQEAKVLQLEAAVAADIKVRAWATNKSLLAKGARHIPLISSVAHATVQRWAPLMELLGLNCIFLV